MRYYLILLFLLSSNIYGATPTPSPTPETVVYYRLNANLSSRLEPAINTQGLTAEYAYSLDGSTCWVALRGSDSPSLNRLRAIAVQVNESEWLSARATFIEGIKNGDFKRLLNLREPSSIQSKRAK